MIGAIVAGHVALALAAFTLVARSLARPWVDQVTPDAATADALRTALPLAALLGSVAALAAGRALGRAERMAALDLASLGGLAVLLFAISLGPLPRDAIGVLLVAAVALRAGPAAWLVATERAPGRLAFAVAFAAYAPLALWLAAAAAPFGDQVHYLLASERLRAGSLDATIDASLFRSLIGADPTEADRATHVIGAPAGPRAVQGYALAALLLPGWALLGRAGAQLVIALVAAWASAQIYLLLRETVRGQRVAGAAWALASFTPPLLPYAAHLYPNALGAALIATGYRLAFTAPVRRYALAGAALALTLLLTPRDGLMLLVLLPFIRHRAAALAAGAIALVAVAANALAYGVPVPYAGYLYGTAAAQELAGEPSLTWRFWVGLPAILFDRTFGVAGSAPWLFLGLLGAASALRAARGALMPAGATIVVSLVALSAFRYWEGGYAPPNRYLVEVLPLAAPFVAYGLDAARSLAPRALAAPLAGLSAVAGAVFAASPLRALNTAYEHRLQDTFDAVFGWSPLGWLPSFQPTTPDWYVGAYLRLLPAVAIVAVLTWVGMRRRPA